MATILKNILRFTGLVVGVPVALPHRLNVNDVPVLPRLVIPNEGGHTVTADTLNVTVTRTALGTATVDVYIEFWHTIEAVVPLVPPPGKLVGLVPFILEPGASILPVDAAAVVAFGNNSVAAAADTRFLDQWRSTTTAGTAETTPIVAPRAGTLRNLFVRHQAAVGNGNSITYRVRINGVNTTITVTLATGAIAQTSDLVNTAAVAQGDRITLSATKALALGNGAVIPSATLEFV
jgi:hypothetical protein